MASKDRLSKDQKRKAKLAKRRRDSPSTTPRPYTGKKYQQPEWTPYVYQTELAIYETILLSKKRLTNAQVKQALDRLIIGLRGELSPRLSEDEPGLSFAPGDEVKYLVGNIRLHWTRFFEDHPSVGRRDLIGILRTILYSIEAQARNTGSARGYVAFLDAFMRDMPIDTAWKSLPSMARIE